MSRSKTIPAVLTIAGSDSGGGAGIQADLKVFAATGVHGLCVITNITAQNPRRVAEILPTPARMVRSQVDSVSEFKPAAAKTGMLYRKEIVQEVIRFASGFNGFLVVDPILVSTSGRALLEKTAFPYLDRLLELASLATPNVAEAGILAGSSIRTPDQALAAARAIRKRYGCAVLLKGGHLPGGPTCIDFLCTDEGEWLIELPRIPRIKTHGTGCTYSAAIAAFVARGQPLLESVTRARELIHRSIAGHRTCSGHPILS